MMLRETVENALENKRVTGPLIGILVTLILFLWVWKSGVEPAPQKRGSHAVEEDEEVPHARPKAAPAPVSHEESVNTFLQEKKTYAFYHINEKYRRVCRLQATSTSSCARLSCDDGKIYCVTSYTEL